MKFISPSQIKTNCCVYFDEIRFKTDPETNLIRQKRKIQTIHLFYLQNREKQNKLFMSKSFFWRPPIFYLKIYIYIYPLSKAWICIRCLEQVKIKTILPNGGERCWFTIVQSVKHHLKQIQDGAKASFFIEQVAPSERFDKGKGLSSWKARTARKTFIHWGSMYGKLPTWLVDF